MCKGFDNLLHVKTVSSYLWITCKQSSAYYLRLNVSLVATKEEMSETHICSFCKIHFQMTTKTLNILSSNSSTSWFNNENTIKVFHSVARTMQKPPRWFPLILTAKNDLDSFFSTRNRFCNHFPSKHIWEKGSMRKCSWDEACTQCLKKIWLPYSIKASRSTDLPSQATELWGGGG